MAVCALTLFLALPSHAGYWDVSYTSQGVSGYDILDGFNPTDLNTPPGSDPWPKGSTGGGSFSVYLFGEANHFSHGTVTATLTWFPANGNSTTDPPDKTVYIQETATAQERAGYWYGIGTQPDMAGTVDNGLGNSVTAIWTGASQVLTCTGTRLIQRDGSLGKIVLDPVSLSAATPITSYASGYPDWVGSGWASVNFQAQQAGPPKSIMINRPENAGANIEADRNTFDFAAGEWTSDGDSRFSNDVTSDAGGEAGSSLDYEDWTCGFVGAPWPPDGVPQLLGDLLTADGSDYYRDWAWYAEATPTTGSLGSDHGDTFSIHKFTPQIRPHVDWPYAQPSYDPSLTVYLPHDLLDEMTSPQVPAAQTYRVNLHLADTPIWATQDTHPDWKFDHHANFNITYHNEYELIATQPTDEVPLAENPWRPVVCNTGTVFQEGQQNENIITEGYYANWSPSFYYQADSNYNVTVTAVNVNGGVGQSTAVGIYRPVPPRTVPIGMVGVVYSRPYIIRCPFTYRQYSAAGRLLPGMGNDTQGNEIPFSKYVDRSAGGFGVNNIVTKIFLCKKGQAFPPKIYDNSDPPPQSPQ